MTFTQQEIDQARRVADRLLSTPNAPFCAICHDSIRLTQTMAFDKNGMKVHVQCLMDKADKGSGIRKGYHGKKGHNHSHKRHAKR